MLLARPTRPIWTWFEANIDSCGTKTKMIRKRHGESLRTVVRITRSAFLSSREKRLAKKYFDKLFKEYCICDLSQWQEKKIAMRWRIDREVVSGKGTNAVRRSEPIVVSQVNSSAARSDATRRNIFEAGKSCSLTSSTGRNEMLW